MSSFNIMKTSQQYPSFELARQSATIVFFSEPKSQMCHGMEPLCSFTIPYRDRQR